MSEKEIRYESRLRARIIDRARRSSRTIVRIVMDCDECGSHWEMVINEDDGHDIRQVADQLDTVAQRHASNTEEHGLPGHDSFSVELIPEITYDQLDVSVSVE